MLLSGRDNALLPPSRPPTVLSAQEREELRAIIEQEILSLEEQLGGMKEKMQPVEPDAAIGRLSRLDSMVNQGTVEMAATELIKRLARLRDKLTRVDDKDFGKCGVCGKWITMERLRLSPDRGICVKCLQKK